MKWTMGLGEAFGEWQPTARPVVACREHAELELPYRLSEAPRLLLHLLARSSNLDPNIRHFITNWLAGYDLCEHAHIARQYGFEGLLMADAITAEISANMATAFAEATERSTAESFAQWSEELTDTP
jgi:hypothetical protein